MTARLIPGNSGASGISSRLSSAPIRFMPGWRMPPCSDPRMRASPGRRFRACGAMIRARAGSLAPAACACTRILLDPRNPARLFVAISAAGTFRSDDGGGNWKPINRGLNSAHLPDPTAEIGHCVHHIAMHPSRPETLFMQKHWDVMRTDDAGESWREISGNLPTDFGFVIDVHRP